MKSLKISSALHNKLKIFAAKREKGIQDIVEFFLEDGIKKNEAEHSVEMTVLEKFFKSGEESLSDNEFKILFEYWVKWEMQGSSYPEHINRYNKITGGGVCLKK